MNDMSQRGWRPSPRAQVTHALTMIAQRAVALGIPADSFDGYAAEARSKAYVPDAKPPLRRLRDDPRVIENFSPGSPIRQPAVGRLLPDAATARATLLGWTEPLLLACLATCQRVTDATAELNAALPGSQAHAETLKHFRWVEAVAVDLLDDLAKRSEAELWEELGLLAGAAPE